jgi:predicted lactoylglutathione lyase
MIGYVTLGTNDIARTGTFYDALLKELGAKRSGESEKYIQWSVTPDAPALVLIKPYDGKPATVGNGVMVSLAAGDRDKVNAVHKKALSLGAKDEGAPGPRGGGFYGAYFRDSDGNKLCAFCMEQR